MRNFSSAAAIVMALDSEFIQCLKETLAELDGSDKALQTKLKGLVNDEKLYCTALDSSKELCVPCLSQQTPLVLSNNSQNSLSRSPSPRIMCNSPDLLPYIYR